ncbi:MAG: DUF1761 domain-containing protein [Pseudomonadota bacterium]
MDAIAQITWITVLAAAIAGYVVGAVWYGALGDRWLAAIGKTKADISDENGRPKTYVPFVLAFLADIVMAIILSGIIYHAGEVTIRAGLISAFLVWAGFVLTTLTVNTAFSMRSWSLIWIDGGHWLFVLLVMGGVIGALGL